MVLNYGAEPVWTESAYISSQGLSEYVLVSNPTQIEMAASSVYGTLPRGPRCHRRGNSEASIPAKYATMMSKSEKTRKKSFFAGLADKLKYAVDGKASNQLHRKLHWSPSEDVTSSNGSLHKECSPMRERKTQERPQRLWARGLENVYSSQRRLSWKKSTKKNSIKDNASEFGSCTSDCSTPSSSAPSSPESQRSFLGNAKRARRGAIPHNGYTSRTSLQDTRESFTSQIPTIEEESKKSSGYKLLIVGAEGVGKSALTVRFLTKRYIGEYAPEIESVYDQTVNVEGKDMNVQLWDSAIPDLYQNSNDDDVNSDSSTLSHSSSMMSVTSSGGSSCRLSNRFSNSSLEEESPNNNKACYNDNTLSRKNKLRQTINKTIRRWRSNEGSESEEDTSSYTTSEGERRLRWADGLVVVYSICDQSSFEAARDIIRYVRQTEATEVCRQGSNIDFAANRIPILLVGNKLDLEHRRQVKQSDGRSLSTAYACSFAELSVSESFEPVSETIREHLKVVKKSAKSRDAFKSKSRKSRW